MSDFVLVLHFLDYKKTLICGRNEFQNGVNRQKNVNLDANKSLKQFKYIYLLHNNASVVWRTIIHDSKKKNVKE